MAPIHTDLDALVREHRSVRRFQTGREIPREHELRIVRAAQRSPSSCNLQTYAFISVKDPEKRGRIAELCARQRYVREASLFYVVCADLHKMEVVCRKAGYRYHQERFLDSFLMAAMDATLAAQTAAWVAESLGYGTCMIGGIRNHPEEVVRLLELPRKVIALVGVCVGYPEKINPVKPRLPLKGVYFEDRYQPAPVEQAIDEYDALMAETGIYSGREMPLEEVVEILRPVEPGTGYGWIEHSARRIASGDPEKTREQLRRVMESAGFGLE